MTARLPEMVQLSGVEPVHLFDFQQQVLFSPKQRGEGFIKLAVTTGKPKRVVCILTSAPDNHIVTLSRGDDFPLPGADRSSAPGNLCAPPLNRQKR